MKFLIALLILTVKLPAFALGPIEVRLQGVSSIESIEAHGAARPSCPMVEHRLQEYAKRTTEADLLLQWYRPYSQTQKGRQALRNVLKRMEVYLEGRRSDKVKVSYRWIIPKEIYQRFKNHPEWTVELRSARFNWSDSYQGTLPPGVSFKVEEETVALAELSTLMNYETFCLEESLVKLRLGIPGLDLVMDAHHDAEML